jgi:hypothetical protein
VSEPVAIASVADFQQHQPDMLAVINASSQSAQLFIADPFRFLSEHGFTVSPALQTEMQNRAPALARVHKEMYDRVAAGSASLSGGATDDVTYHIRTLGVNLS